jgi:hypothetical protein
MDPRVEYTALAHGPPQISVAFPGQGFAHWVLLPYLKGLNVLLVAQHSILAWTPKYK